MACDDNPDYPWDKSLQELQEMEGEISPEEEKILEQVRLKRLSEHRTFD